MTPRDIAIVATMVTLAPFVFVVLWPSLLAKAIEE